MTIRFMDPVEGNDANDGLTFATRKRTFNSATTGIATGDVVRVIASPDPVSIGSATWTDNSRTVAWANSSNQRVDGCDSGWVGATNVTVSHDTSTSRKTGSASLTCAIASAFTTGKIAYKALAAPLNLAAFQQLAFFFKVSSTSTTMNIKIAFCSDTTGDVIEYELNKVLTTTEIPSSNVWFPQTWDFGASFPSTPINSIAIYANADPSTSTRSFYFDAFTCCKAPGAAGLIDHFTLIGKNTEGEPEWYPVIDMSENGIEIASNSLTLINEVKPYRGITETTATYIRNPLVLAAPWSGTEADLKKWNFSIEGGWDRTDMSTRTGETWISGAGRYTAINGVTATNDNIGISGIGLAHCTFGAINLAVGDGAGLTPAAYDFLGFIACETPVTFLSTGAIVSAQYRNAGYFKFSCRQVWASRLPMYTPDRPGEYTVGRIHGHSYDNGLIAAWRPGLTFDFNPTTYNIGKIDNNKYGVQLSKAGNGLKLSGTVFSNNSSRDFRTFTVEDPIVPVRLHLDNIEDLMLDDVTMSSKLLAQTLQDYPTVVTQSRIGGDPNKHRTVLGGCHFFEASQAVRHTESGYSWRYFVPDGDNLRYYRPDGAAGLPLGAVAVEAGKLATVTCWLFVEHDFFTTWAGTAAEPHALFGIMTQPDQAMGLSRIQVTGDMSLIGSWQQLVLTFTPSASGVVPVYAFGYGDGDYLDPPSLFSVYYDDLDVIQEA